MTTPSRCPSRSAYPSPSPSTSPTPTAEQITAVDAFRGGAHLVIQAGAGTGKTTTLAMLARSTRRHGRYPYWSRSSAPSVGTPSWSWSAIPHRRSTAGEGHAM